MPTKCYLEQGGEEIAHYNEMCKNEKDEDWGRGDDTLLGGLFATGNCCGAGEYIANM